jgi:hypothetical protein
MTLIQIVATEDITILVADRRPGQQRNQNRRGQRLHQTGVLKHELRYRFTGLARIDPAQKKSTSEWIAETICDNPDFMPGIQALVWHMREQMSGVVPLHHAEHVTKLVPKAQLDVLAPGRCGDE